MKITTEKEKEGKWKSRRNKQGRNKTKYTDQTSIYLEWLEMYILVNIKLVFISLKKILKNM